MLSWLQVNQLMVDLQYPLTLLETILTIWQLYYKVELDRRKTEPN
jgi:hypothetical protein